MNPVLTDNERDRFDSLARIMLPGGSGMPSAETLDLTGSPVETVLAIDPSRIDGLKRFLGLEGLVANMADIETLAQRDPDAFGDLGVVLANAYFMHSRVREAIGYPGQEARDSSVGLSHEDLALLQPVIDRGPIYRDR
ncbi:MAG: hypothetical protein AAF940_02295 [Pseudomonadota bacterium]